MNKKLIAFVVAVVLGFTAVTACGSQSEVACASTIESVYYAPSPPAPRAPTPAPAPRSPTPAPKTPSAPSGGNGGAKPVTPAPANKPGQNGAPKTQSQTNAAKPGTKPTPSDASKAKAEAPSRVTRGGSYYSSVTGDTYVYQNPSYFSRPGYIVNYYNPYDPFNYWLYPMSPFYGSPYRVAGSCGEKEKEIKNTNNITIVLDSEGKVVSSTDPENQSGTTIKPTGTTAVLK